MDMRLIFNIVINVEQPDKKKYSEDIKISLNIVF